MEFEIYIDTYFLLNFFFDFFLLLFLKGIEKKEAKWKNLMLAAGIGAIMACLIFWVPNIIFFFLLYLASSSIMLWIAFGYEGKKAFILSTIKLYGISFFLGGAIVFFRSHLDNAYVYNRKYVNHKTDSNFGFGTIFILFALSGIILLCICHILKKEQQEQKKLYKVKLYYEGKSIETIGLMDTGNFLKEPITNKPVIIIEEEIIHELIQSEFYYYIKQIAAFQTSLEETIPDEYVSKVKMIPYHSIGTKRGLMPALILEQVILIKGNYKKINHHIVAAIYYGELSKQNKYHVILHEELI